MTDALLLDLFTMGVATLDAEGRVRAANRRARRVFEAGDGITASGGRIVMARRDDAAALARLLGSSCEQAALGALHAVGAFQIEGGSGQPKPTLLVAHAHGWPDEPTIEHVLFLHEPSVPVAVSESILRTLHGLTRTEARITALLVRGHTVAAIGAATGSGMNTVRTHLKRVFAKLDVASQAALIRAVLSGPAALPLEGGQHGVHSKCARGMSRDASRVAPR